MADFRRATGANPIIKPTENPPVNKPPEQPAQSRINCVEHIKKINEVFKKLLKDVENIVNQPNSQQFIDTFARDREDFEINCDLIYQLADKVRQRLIHEIIMDTKIPKKEETDSDEMDDDMMLPPPPSNLNNDLVRMNEINQNVTENLQFIESLREILNNFAYPNP